MALHSTRICPSLSQHQVSLLAAHVCVLGSTELCTEMCTVAGHRRLPAAGDYDSDSSNADAAAEPAQVRSSGKAQPGAPGEASNCLRVWKLGSLDSEEACGDAASADMLQT